MAAVGAGLAIIKGMSSSHIFPCHDVLAHERTWCEAAVEAYGGAAVVLSESVLDLRALSFISHTRARALGLLPLGWLDGRVQVAAAAPLDPVLHAELERCFGYPVVGLLAATALLPGAIDAAYAAASVGTQTLAGLRTSLTVPHLELVPSPGRRGTTPPSPHARRSLGRRALPDWLEALAVWP
jgi:hypothetical protein